MIKNLLDADENPPEGTKVIIEETTIEAPHTANMGDAVSSDRTVDAENTLELSPLETANAAPVGDNFTDASKVEDNRTVPFQTALFEPESQAETVRKSGLAYAAAITLFAAVVFMMIIGWGADLLLGTSPWGIAAGIVLGALIGFIQFFRMTAQILKNKD